MRHAVLAIGLLAGLAGCDSRTGDAAFDDKPKAYVEFFFPTEQSESAVDVDAQVFRLENGERVFQGMTKKWSGLTEQRHGLTVTSPVGLQQFVISANGALTHVELKLLTGEYRRVRISFVDVKQHQFIGTTLQLSFGIRAAEEKAGQPGG